MVNKSETRTVPPICPKCKSKNVVSILWGFPSIEGFEAWEREEIKLGGCCVSDNDPKWFCKDCEHEFGESDISKRLKKEQTIG